MRSHLNSNNKLLLTFVLVFLIGLNFYIAEGHTIDSEVFTYYVIIINVTRSFIVLFFLKTGWLPIVTTSCDGL